MKSPLFAASWRDSGFLPGILGLLLISSISLLNADSPDWTQPSSDKNKVDAQTQLELSRAELESKLDRETVSPEEKAVLIEAWLIHTDALLQSAAEEQIQMVDKDHAPAVSIPLPPVPAAASPLKRDILEMENEILDFHNFLNGQPLEPEERARQIEAFLDHNSFALKELETYRLQLSQQQLGTENSTTSLLHVQGQTPEDTARIREIRDILTQAEELEPEERAILIEANLTKLDELPAHLLKAEKSADQP